MAKLRQLLLTNSLSPGDILVMTAAVYSLHTQFPNEYQTNVECAIPAIWENNPHITKITGQVEKIEMKYPTIHRSNQTPVNFISSYCEFLAEQLKIPLRMQINRPVLYISNVEKQWINQVRQEFSGEKDINYWIVNAGIKHDYTTKSWPVEHYQQVVDNTIGQIQWVQIGQKGHNHPPLSRVLDLREKTDTRQLIRLVYHCKGAIGPSTFLQHLCAAFEKPYICLLGGREPTHWVNNPLQHTLHSMGALDCCKTHACWTSRTVALPDKDSKNNSLCKYPVLGIQRASPKCMAMITPARVTEVLRMYI